MGGHNRRHTCRTHFAERHDVCGFQLRHTAAVLRQDMMAVAFDEAVAGEVFAARLHAAAVQPFL